eukprot:TRINITY_DN368_c1_g4_i7.p2 TRINITY_DN368_c1_g4~~TRINITY_DN368_c1_g4_i7.p2  ORF type:complete len:204 (-),score=87.04 TRINITY_DN368_c1_g4_i7:1248-1859(-)
MSRKKSKIIPPLPPPSKAHFPSKVSFTQGVEFSAISTEKEKAEDFDAVLTKAFREVKDGEVTLPMKAMAALARKVHDSMLKGRASDSQLVDIDMLALTGETQKDYALITCEFGLQVLRLGPHGLGSCPLIMQEVAFEKISFHLVEIHTDDIEGQRGSTDVKKGRREHEGDEETESDKDEEVEHEREEEEEEEEDEEEEEEEEE